MRDCRVVTKPERPKRERQATRGGPAASLGTQPPPPPPRTHARTHTLKQVLVFRCCSQHLLFFGSCYSDSGGAGATPFPAPCERST